MIQQCEFTTAVMAAALEETGVTYEELEDLEAGFEDVETEIRKLLHVTLAGLPPSF